MQKAMSESPRTVLQADGLCLCLPGGKAALDQVGLELQAQERLVVVGESGAGKTTLLRLLAGLLAPTSGRVIFRPTPGVEMEPCRQSGIVEQRMRRRLQLVWQDSREALDPAMTGLDAVAQGAALALPGQPRGQHRDLAEALLQALGLDGERAERRPARLSGGECRRVVLARALAALGCSPETSPAAASGEPGQAAVLLLDEPTAGLDQDNRQRLLDLVSRVASRHALSLVVVTHELPLARSWGDSLLVLAGGRVVERGRREDLFDASGAFVATHPYGGDLAVALAAWDRLAGNDTVDES